MKHAFGMLAVLVSAVGFAGVRYDSFRPGAEWLDTEGRPIQAHGGSIIVVGGVYYWYGENKEKTDGVADVWHWGVNLYSSKDLYNWKHEGTVMPPDLKDPASPLSPKACMDRPHILYNERTKKFVCFLKVMQKERGQLTSVLTADAITGPWKIVRTGLKPCGMDAGDFDLAKASDGKAYYYFERVHSELICADLTDDYTDVTGYYSTHAPRISPPYVREAPAHFLRDGKHYLFTSGTTGYWPNPSETFVADTWHGPWTSLGDPHVGDASRTSFRSQITSVFKVPGKKDLYIALADRWLPEQTDITYAETEAMYCKWFGRPFDAALADSFERKRKKYKEATKNARYVWLPVVFKGERPTIEWRDEWRLSEFE